MLKKMNKKGDIVSIIYIIIFLAVIGIILFFISDINYRIFNEFNNTLKDTSRNTTYVDDVLSKTVRTNNSAWDYAFLGIFVGSLIAIVLSAYAVRISPVFYWIYGILALVMLALGTILSNVWQEMVSDPELAITITRFPITNAILGGYYPIVTVVIVVMAMVIIFGKPPGREEGYI